MKTPALVRTHLKLTRAFLSLWHAPYLQEQDGKKGVHAALAGLLRPKPTGWVHTTVATTNVWVSCDASHDTNPLDTKPRAVLQWEVVSESGKAMITQMLDLDEHRRSTAAALLKVGGKPLSIFHILGSGRKCAELGSM
jgi:hypothetical protein